MRIDDELTSFLDERIREHSSTDKDRNIEIIRYYYGFGEAERPTYREIARKFPGIVTRERVRQIIDQFFRRPVKATGLPSMDAFQELLESRSYWRRYELENAVENALLMRGRFSIRGLFSLMHDLEIEHGFGIYSARLRPAPRTPASDSEIFFIIREADIEEIRSLNSAALKLPGRYGIANLNYLRSECHFSTYKTLIENLIEYAPDSWTRREGNALWYMYENRSNPLTTLSKRVFSVMGPCQVERLAGAFRNGLLRRPQEHPLSSVSLISKYLRTSRNFERAGDAVSFNGDVTHQATRIDSDVFTFLSESGAVTYTDLRRHLTSKGHTLSSVQHAAFHSPLVHKNRETYAVNTTYELVGIPRSSEPET